MGFGFVTGDFAKWLVPIIYAMCGLAFLADLLRDNTLAYGLIYTPLIATAVFHKGRQGVWILSALTILMVVVGGFVPVVDSDLPDLIANRVMSILAILATATFVTYSKIIQNRLAGETRRAEAAEAIKSDVLAHLTQDLRTPMYKLLGLLTLMLTNCRPDQREALQHVRSGSRQLVDSIDTLIDLTQLNDRTFDLQPIDVAGIARAAVDSAKIPAADRQIIVSIDGVQQAQALGDEWATRRIMDSLLSNAIRLTPPGGTVSVSVTKDSDTATASVTDADNGFLSLAAIQLAGSNQDNQDTGNTELLLSKRLAIATSGRLTAIDRQNGSGHVVSLSLPAA